MGFTLSYIPVPPLYIFSFYFEMRFDCLYPSAESPNYTSRMCALFHSRGSPLTQVHSQLCVPQQIVDTPWEKLVSALVVSSGSFGRAILGPGCPEPSRKGSSMESGWRHSFCSLVASAVAQREV